MNRLQFGPLALMESARTNPPLSCPSPSPTLPTTAYHSQRVFIPSSYEAHYAYPLLLYFHDQRQDSSQLQRVMPEISCRNYVGAAFGSPMGTDPWAAWQQQEPVIDSATEAMQACIHSVQQRLNINLKKIFLMGLGAGGSMALRLALCHPERVAGVISINGDLPSRGRLLARLKLARQVPVFLAHYRDSVKFLESQLCRRMCLLHSAGFSLTVRQYPCGDDGCSQIYRDINEWVMEQVTSGTE